MEKSLKNVMKFLILTFIQTWFFYFAIVVFRLSAYEGLGLIFLICGGMAPSLIGVIMVFTTYRKEDRKDFFKRVYQAKRIGFGWWIFMLLIFPATHAVTVLITLISGGEMPAMEGLRDAVQSPASILIVLLVGFFFNGAFPEEFGWRGFALEPLLNRFGFVKANLLLGSIWSVWHLPLFFMPAQYHYHLGFVGFWFFFAHTIGLSMIMSLVFIKTKYSILSALLMHMLSNLSSNMMFSFSETYERINLLMVFAIGIIIGIYMKARIKTC
jgi:membrane protease YdiL (CAAX protease family)